MSINADNIIGTYDIYTKQYILTFTEKPTLIESTDCSFQISIIPEFECSYSGLNVPDGIVGNTVTATATEGTIGTITPSTYQLGSTTYSVQITAPGGYTNAGNIILCTDTATGTPTFVCGDAGLSVNDGNVGATVTGTVTAGTIVSFSPSTYVSGSNNYTATITVPSGYSNTGSTINCVDSATGTVPAYAQITGVTSATINNNISLTGEDVGFTGSTWAWTGGAAAGLTSKVITITETSSGTQTYGVTINGTYSDTHNVTWSPPAPFIQINAPTSGTVNSNITLTAEDYNFTGSTWAWTGGAAQGLTSKTITITETSTGSVTYGATVDGTYTDTHTVNWAASLPLFTCTEADFGVADGTTGDTIVLNTDATVTEGTLVSINPTTYQSGTTSYTATITPPASGYSNSGGSNISCTATATGTAAGTTYTCSDAGYTQADGVAGNSTSSLASFTDSNITTYTISPSTYTSGSATYTATITVPAGYTNTGSTINCTATAFGESGSISPDPITSFTQSTSGSTTIQVTSNVTWSLNFPGAYGSYFSVSPSGGSAGTNINVTLTYTVGDGGWAGDQTIRLTSTTPNILDTATIEYSP